MRLLPRNGRREMTDVRSTGTARATLKSSDPRAAPCAAHTTRGRPGAGGEKRLPLQYLPISASHGGSACILRHVVAPQSDPGAYAPIA